MRPLQPLGAAGTAPRCSKCSLDRDSAEEPPGYPPFRNHLFGAWTRKTRTPSRFRFPVAVKVSVTLPVGHFWTNQKRAVVAARCSNTFQRPETCTAEWNTFCVYHRKRYVQKFPKCKPARSVLGCSNMRGSPNHNPLSIVETTTTRENTTICNRIKLWS